MTRAEFFNFLLVILALCSMLIVIAATARVVADLTNHHPRLVGYGCVGASGPLYADEEDHFPNCRSIERN